MCICLIQIYTFLLFNVLKREVFNDCISLYLDNKLFLSLFLFLFTQKYKEKGGTYYYVLLLISQASQLSLKPQGDGTTSVDLANQIENIVKQRIVSTCS